MYQRAIVYATASSAKIAARLLRCCFVMLGALPVLAQAQTLEEVVVTAQKREQALQDVGISVSALPGDVMRDAGITGPLTLAQAVPAVQFNSASGGNYGMQLTIRGIAQSDYSPHQESPNSMYIDDVYLSAPNMQSAQMFDLQRVEVLRGPQGTLFGRNSTGGLVNFITAKPTAEKAGYVEAQIGNYNLARVEGAISGALSHRVRGRLSGLYVSHDGLKENHFPGQRDIDDLDFYGVRGQLEVDVSDNLIALFRIHYLDDDNREGFYSHISSYFGPDGRPAPLPANLDFWGTGPGNDLQGYRSPYTGPEGEVDFVGLLKRNITSPSVVLTWELGDDLTLTSIANYTLMDFRFDESCSGAPHWSCRDPFQQHLRQWSEEIRLNGGDEQFTWVGGLNALSIHSRSTGGFSSPFYAGGDFAYDVFNEISQRTDSLAVFGQGEWRFTERWRGTLGLRVTRDEKSFSSQAYLREIGDFSEPFGDPSTVFDPPIILPIVPEPSFPDLDVYDFSKATVGDFAVHESTDVSGKVQVDYIPNENALMYISISRGIKNAGFSGNSGGTTPITGTPFNKEQVLVYEVGEKLTLLDNRLQLNGAVYYYDYKDYQGFQLNTSIGISPFVVNADAEFTGVEFELVAVPIEGLELRASFNWLDSTVKDVETSIGRMDQKAADAPEWMANWFVRYSWPIGRGSVALQYSGDFIDEKYHSIDNAPISLVKSSTGHNARISYERDNWKVAAFATNFTDEDRQQSAYDLTASFGYGIATWSPPRQVGISASYAFGQ